MGLFLAMSGVIGVPKADVEKTLASFAATRRGTFRPDTRSTNDSNTLVLLEEASRCSVLYPWGFLDWDQASKYLSEQLSAPVFSFHVHDEDLWMFVLFDKGEQVAQFNPLPEYWDDSISDADRAFWSGDANVVVSHVPGVSAATLQPYFQHWDFENPNPGKAFPDDRFAFQDCWQLCDFMEKLGLKYPLDDTGNVLGETYAFDIPEGRLK